MAELTAVCKKIGITVEEDATAESLTGLIAEFTFTENSIKDCVKAELKTICDVLEITYDSNATNNELKALILAA